MLPEKVKIEADHHTLIALNDKLLLFVENTKPNATDFMLKLIITTIIGLIKTISIKTLFANKKYKFSIKTTEAFALQYIYVKGMMQDDLHIKMLIGQINQKTV
jgi:hypothetical protein